MSLQSTPSWPFVPSRIAPLQIADTTGAYLVTPSGRRIFDAAAGAGVGNIGWGRGEVIEAMSASAQKRTYVLPNLVTEERLELVARLQENWLPRGLSRVFLAGSGSEAMDASLRLARQYHCARGETKRWKMIGREVSYHGTTLATLAVGGHAGRRAPFEPLLPPHPKIAASYCLRCSLGKTYPSCEMACARMLEEVIEQEGPDTVAAFVAEAIVGSSGGALVPHDPYWKIVREVCDRHGILLIIDEVMTGFGRTGRAFACHHWGLMPDILVLGKGLAGGYAPLSAVVASEQVIAPLIRNEQPLMFHTFSAHPSSCAAANATLRILQREDLVAAAASLGDFLTEPLGRLRAHPHVAEVRGRGLLYAVEVVADKKTLERFAASASVTQRIVSAALAQDVLFYPGGTGRERDIIMMAPHFISERQELSNMVEVLIRAIDGVVGEMPPAPANGA